MRSLTERGRRLCSKTLCADLAMLAVIAGSALGPCVRRAEAQVSPNGSELQVNSFTTSTQASPAVASDTAGNFVVAWQSYGSSGTDTSSHGIQAQRYDPTGTPLGSELQVNTFTTSLQASPAVASDAAGNFVVAWQSAGSSGTDTSSSSVQAQRYDATGNLLGSQFQVNTFTTSYQTSPAVASDATGDFVVAWESNGSSGTDTSSKSVQAQRYDATGNPLGSQFQVNSYTTNSQDSPAVASDAAGNFVVVWQSFGSGGTDTSYRSVQAQRYNSTGNPLGSQFQVNTYTTSYQTSSAVASDAAGNFVVVWQSTGSVDTDTSGTSVQAQRYNSTGNPLGGQFRINTYTTSHQTNPAVASDATGNFVVAWESFGSGGTDSSYRSVQAQRYDATGNPLGGQFQVNSYTTSYQSDPAVASDPAGNFVVAWESYGSSGTDTSYWSVQAQRYDGLFRDGFENSDASRWSAVVP